MTSDRSTHTHTLNNFDATLVVGIFSSFWFSARKEHTRVFVYMLFFRLCVEPEKIMGLVSVWKSEVKVNEL